MYRTLYKFVLKVEERPIVTRFWLFSDCVHTLLRAKLLDIPVDCFALHTVHPHKENSKRLAKFRAFYIGDDSDQPLRIASLCLQLTEHAVSITAQKHNSDRGGRAVPSVPILVRLGRREIQVKTATDLQRILLNLHVDPHLDVIKAVVSLLTTSVHLFARFEIYSEFPTQIWTLSRVYNLHGYVTAIEHFLDLADNQLDVGYSLPLRSEALQLGDRADALLFLTGDTVQREIEEICELASCTSLDVERKHYQDKRSEKDKVTSVARTSRNSILQRYLIDRRKKLVRLQSFAS